MSRRPHTNQLDPPTKDPWMGLDQKSLFFSGDFDDFEKISGEMPFIFD